MESRKKTMSIDIDDHKLLKLMAGAAGKNIKELCGEIVRDHYRAVKDRLTFPELREQ